MQGINKKSTCRSRILGLTAGANAALAITLAFIPSINYFRYNDSLLYRSSCWGNYGFRNWHDEKGGFSPLRIVLAGAAVSAFLYAIAEGVGIYFKVSKDVSMWTAGGLIGTSLEST